MEIGKWVSCLHSGKVEAAIAKQPLVSLSTFRSLVTNKACPSQGEWAGLYRCFPMEFHITSIWIVFALYFNVFHTNHIYIYIFVYYISVCSFHFKIFHISIGSFCILFATAASPDPNGSAPFHVSQDHPEPCPCRQHQHWTGRPNHHRSIPKDAGEFSLGWPVFHYSSRFWFEQYHTLLDDLGMLCTLGKTTISRCKWNDSLL